MSTKSTTAKTELIATRKVDKWLDELRGILVDRSEFKLADHVVSARVLIRMLEKDRNLLVNQRDELAAKLCVVESRLSKTKGKAI